MSLRRSFPRSRAWIACATLLLPALSLSSHAAAAQTRTRHAQVGDTEYRLVETEAEESVSSRLEVAVASDSGTTPRVRWSELLSWSHTPGPFRTRVVYAVGMDTMTITAPSGGLAPRDTIPTAVEVEVNGITAVVDFPALERLASASDVEASELEQPLVTLASAFRDGARFADAVQRFESLRADVSPDPAARRGLLDPCFRPCATCAASTVAWVGSWFTLAAACAAVVPSGGIIAPGCLGAMISHGAINIALVSSCAECAACREEQSRCCDCKYEPGKPDCDCGARPPCPPRP